MKREPALSEVIGFLLIVSLLAILFSMYLLYVVPLQGRDAEIAHMSDVKEQFSAIKMGIDSLIVNEQKNYRLQYQIPLGTGSGGATGSFSILPMQSYAGSSGELRVDTETDSLGELEIYISGTGIELPNTPTGSEPFTNVYYSHTISGSDISGDPSDSSLAVDPQHFFILYNVTDPAKILSINAINWSATAGVIPKYNENFVNISKTNPMPYDLALTIIKDGNTTFENLTIAEYVSSSNNPYIINLYDWAYGLVDILKETYSFTYSISGIPESDTVNISQLAYSPVISTDPISISVTGVLDRSLPQLQVLEYRSQNRYWVNQQYQYQWGATFVSQTEGTALMASPPVVIMMDDSNNLLNVDITDTIITTHQQAHIPLVSISGSQENPLQVTLTELSPFFEIGGDTYQLLDQPDQANARYIIIGAKDFGGNEQVKWKNTFSTIANTAIHSDTTGHLSPINVVVKDLIFEDGSSGIGLIIAWDGQGAKNLDALISDGSLITDVTTILNANYPDNHLKVDYKQATIKCSLYNLAL